MWSVDPDFLDFEAPLSLESRLGEEDAIGAETSLEDDVIGWRTWKSVLAALSTLGRAASTESVTAGSSKPELLVEMSCCLLR